MKTKLSQLILPMLVIVFAVTSAFTTHAENKSKNVALVTGYIQHIGAQQPCEASNQCSTVTSATFCKVGQIATNPRLWDKNANDECIVPLYKP
jgi:hypothetical protein